MSRVYDCRDDAERTDGVAAAAAAIARGQLVVLPTDTVYGVGADAFDPVAVAALLAAKGRGRDAPPPVLVAGPDVLPALTSDLTPQVEALTAAFWPGGLTVICWAQASLQWDLGDTGGTVAVRVPDHDLAVQLLRATGPLAVSSANLTGQPPGDTAAATRSQLGDSVQVYLEDGELPGGTPSSIVDATGETLVLRRAGAISLEQLREVVPEVVDGTDGAVATPAAPAEEPPAPIVEPPAPTEGEHHASHAADVAPDLPAEGAGERPPAAPGSRRARREAQQATDDEPGADEPGADELLDTDLPTRPEG